MACNFYINLIAVIVNFLGYSFPDTFKFLLRGWLVKSFETFYLRFYLLQFFLVFSVVTAFSIRLWIQPIHFAVIVYSIFPSVSKATSRSNKGNVFRGKI